MIDTKLDFNIVQKFKLEREKLELLQKLEVPLPCFECLPQLNVPPIPPTTPRVPTQTGKPGKMEKLFSVREKSGNFVQTGKVREIWTKYWKSQGNLENFYFLCYF